MTNYYKEIEKEEIKCPICRIKMDEWSIYKAFVSNELFGNGKICMREQICYKHKEQIDSIELTELRRKFKEIKSKLEELNNIFKHL